MEGVVGDDGLPGGLGVTGSVNLLVRLSFKEPCLGHARPPEGDLVQLSGASQVILALAQQPGQLHPGLGVLGSASQQLPQRPLGVVELPRAIKPSIAFNSIGGLSVHHHQAFSPISEATTTRYTTRGSQRGRGRAAVGAALARVVITSFSGRFEASGSRRRRRARHRAHSSRFLAGGRSEPNGLLLVAPRVVLAPELAVGPAQAIGCFI